MRRLGLVMTALAAGCYTAPPVELPDGPSVVFTYPVDQQRDVPLGARLLVSFSAAVGDDVASGVRVVGPSGAVASDVKIVGQGRTLAITSSTLEPGTTYEVHAPVSATAAGSAGDDGASAGTLFRFTTRSDQPLPGAPALVAFNGSDPASPGSFRPIFETSTLELVFSEPLDPRTALAEPGAIELVDGNGVAVPATLLARGIHAVLDPVDPLVPGATYVVRLGDKLADLAGETLVPATVAFTPVDSIGRGAIDQTFRTRQAGDAVAAVARTDVTNAMEVAHPLIGTASAAMLPAVLATRLGDPLALGGPISFTIPKGQRLSSSALAVALAGTIPSGLSTGEIEIELITDGGGRLYRNRYQSPDTLPDNTRSPLLVDLSFDLAIYATDPTGNAVLAQTALGVQLSGIAIADEGALAIETLGALDIGLLGITSAPANIVLDLISDPRAARAGDAQPPTLVRSLPAADTRELAPDDGIELAFDEPIDIARARAGGIQLLDDLGTPVPASIELHGAVAVVRSRASLHDGERYTVALTDIADLAGNTLAPQSFELTTQPLAHTDVPASVVSVYPGAPCALVDPSATSPGRCAGGSAADDHYRPFTLAANERVAVAFDQPLRRASAVLGAACNTGSVRIERVNGEGACVEPVAGSLVVRDRELAFVPARPWLTGERYRLRLVSGANATCDAGELCGVNGRPPSFDPLAGTTGTASGGPDLVVDFTGAPATQATTLFAAVSPAVDLNGSGRVDAGETAQTENRVALRIAGTGGLLTFANFQGPDCLPETPEVESCMYIAGEMPAQLGERRDNCTLPDGSTVATCIPVTLGAQAMYSTAVTMTAGALGIGLTADTGMSVMRVREPADHPLEGYIVDRAGTPTLVVALDLYMDAPDMSLPLAQHDMHSKPLAVSLEGPLTFTPDGRIAIALRNTAEVPITVGINAPLGIQGTVNLVVPAGEMHLQLMSKPQRGSLP